MKPKNPRPKSKRNVWQLDDEPPEPTRDTWG